MRIVVTDRPGAGRILCSRRRRIGIAYVVSIGGAADRRPAGWRNAAGRLRLIFEDCLSEAEGGPTAEDVARLISFARQLDPGRGAVLVHCQAGISRSVAAATIILAVALGPGQEFVALEHVLRSRPVGRPNERMLELADIALGNGGALVRAWRRVGESGRRSG